MPCTYAHPTLSRTAVLRSRDRYLQRKGCDLGVVAVRGPWPNTWRACRAGAGRAAWACGGGAKPLRKGGLLSTTVLSGQTAPRRPPRDAAAWGRNAVARSAKPARVLERPVLQEDPNLKVRLESSDVSAVEMS